MEKEIKDLTKEELETPEIILGIVDSCKNLDEQKEIVAQLQDAALTHHVKKIVDRTLNKRGILKKANVVEGELVKNKDDETEITIENYVIIMNTDPKIANAFYYDDFLKQVICTRNKTSKWWDDSDDSWLKSYIENNYHIYNIPKYYDAFNVVAQERKVHPIKMIIEDEKWDGKPRIDRFLIDILGCKDDDYSKEVARMIFYGGINRLYHPGCKFDYMPIFIGKQGCGKSSIVSWLALKDTYYKDISSIDGKDGMESLDGAWLCEMAELLAMVRSKDVEAMKAYISRTSDKYRKAYERRVSNNPRQCIFIGTTNDDEFLVDKTGNRRYLPIKVNSDGRELYKHEKQIRNYILQCWRESLVLLKEGKTYLNMSSELQLEAELRQKQVMMDDPRVGLILDYLNNKQIGERVCGIELFTKCVNGLKKNYNMGEAKEIARIMSRIPCWEKDDRRYSTNEYGRQRGWIKTDGTMTNYTKLIDIDEEEGYEDLE